MEQQEIVEARNRLGAGRIIAKNLQPYFARGLDSIETVEKPGTGRITVDKYWRLYYDPEYCLSLTAKELASEWLHNINHLFRGHPERFENIEDAEKSRSDFNVSADAIINSELLKEGVIMPNPEKKPYIENGASIGWEQGMPVEQLYWLAVTAKRAQMDSKGAESNEATTPVENDSNPSEENTGLPNEVSDTENEAQTEPSGNNEQKGGSDEENKEKTEGNSDPQNPNDSLDDSPSFDESEPKDEDTSSGEKDGGDSESDDASQGNADGKQSEDEAGKSEGESSNANDRGVPDKQKGANEQTDVDDSNADNSSAGESGVEEDSKSSDDYHTNKSSEDFDNGNESDEHGDQQRFNGFTESSQSHTEREYADYDDDADNDEAKGLGSDEHDCGSGAGGDSREWEDEPDEKAMDPTNAEILKGDMANDMINHERNNPGSVPGDLIRDAKRVLEPEYDWIQEFMNLLRKEAGSALGRMDHTYSRMSKKQSSQNPIIFPGWEAPDPFEVAVVIDTSGSMSENVDIALALGLLGDLLKDFAGDTIRGGLHLISCDAGATATFVKDLTEVQLVGGGGTDMRQGIRLASKIKPKVDVIITITDGGTSWMKQIPEANRKAKYIAVLVGEKLEKGIPDWMHVIKVDVPPSRSQFKPYSG